MLFDLKKYADATALVTEDGCVSYDTLSAMAGRIAAAVGHRTLVFLLCRNRAVALAAYIGFIESRIVPIMVDAALDAELAMTLLTQYQPEYLWLPEERTEDFSGEVCLRLDGYVLLRRLQAAANSLYGDLALLMTTSGSTGSPKLVRQSYQNLRANTQSIIKYLQIDECERAVTNLPLHYVYGLSIVNTHLMAGASLVVTEKTLFNREFWKIMQEWEVTSLAGVPYTYQMLARLRFFNMNLPALKTLTQAGGKLDQELHRRFASWAEAKGKNFVIMYGAAEATARMGWLPSSDSLRKVGSMGIAIPGGRFELIDDQGRIIIEPKVTGELVYYGKNVTLGYAESAADLALGDKWQGRYVTGDMAQFDEEGYYTIVGRRTRFLKIFGKRANLEEAEHLLHQQFPEAELACAGKDDELWIFAEQEQLLSEMKKYLCLKSGIHISAVKTQKVTVIPRSESGKVLYQQLATYYNV